MARFYCIFVLQFGPKSVPRAKILDSYTKKFSEGGFSEKGIFWGGGVRRQLIMKIEILHGGGIVPPHPFLC